MNTQPGGNSSGASRPVSYDGQREIDTFDRLPKPIREALRESPFDYSAIEVEQAYRQVRDEMMQDRQTMFDILVRGNSMGRNDGPAIQRLLWMIRQNIYSDMQEYRDLLDSVPRKH